MIQNDKWIKRQTGSIIPFTNHKVTDGVISYGLSSFGYDIRLSEKEFKVFKHLTKGNADVDPKNFDVECLSNTPLLGGTSGRYYMLPPHAYGLGVSHERISMPDNTTAVCLGKSTYARCGVIANITPLEAGWCGHITLEFSNSSDSPVRLYANEGIVQLLFFTGEYPQNTYGDGKYNNQKHEITVARMKDG